MRFTARVDGHVPLEGVLLRKGLPTLGANDLFSLLVLRQQMLVEVLLSDHSSFTYVTLVLGLVVGPLLMNVERTAVLAELSANVAIQRGLSVMESHVIGEISLDFELFRTELTLVLVPIGVFPYKVRL